MYQSFKFIKAIGHKYYFRIETHTGDFLYFFTFKDLSGIGIGDKSDTVSYPEDLVVIGTVFMLEKENIRKAIKEANKKPLPRDVRDYLEL